MKKFFLDNIGFRLISPVLTGIILYMLILTLFNDISIIYDGFITKELIFCVILSFAIQEIALLIFKASNAFELKTFILIPITLIVIATVVSFLLNVYYQLFNSYSPATFEYIIFIVVYSLLALFYISLKISYNYLNRKNEENVAHESLLREDIERDFQQFKNGINPKLLFTSLESLITLSKHDVSEADNLLDQLSTVYRYILSKRKSELAECKDEVEIAKELVKLFNHLPYAKIHFECEESIDTLIVPGALLYLIELIIKKSIRNKLEVSKIALLENGDELILNFSYSPKLGDEIKSLDFQMLNTSYLYYTDREIQLGEDVAKNQIRIPKLNYNSTN